MDPVEVGVHGGDEGLDGGVEVVSVAQENVVVAGDGGVDFDARFRLLVADWDDALAGGDGALNLLGAGAGDDGGVAEQE
jgi:hypothetical protein